VFSPHDYRHRLFPGWSRRGKVPSPFQFIEAFERNYAFTPFIERWARPPSLFPFAFMVLLFFPPPALSLFSPSPSLRLRTGCLRSNPHSMPFFPSKDIGRFHRSPSFFSLTPELTFVHAYMVTLADFYVPPPLQTDAFGPVAFLL